MKPQNIFFKTRILLFAIILIIGCSKDDSVNSGNGDEELIKSDGISEDDLERYLGSLGISISARDIAKKGYTNYIL